MAYISPFFYKKREKSARIMVENIEPPSNQPKPIQPMPKKMEPSGGSNFKNVQGMSSMFMKLSKGNQKMANEMLKQTLHLASMTIMSQMNHLTQTMRKNNQDV